MKENKVYLIIGIIFLISLSGCQLSESQVDVRFAEVIYSTGSSLELNLSSPNEYQRPDAGKQMIWNHTIEISEQADYLRLNFSILDIPWEYKATSYIDVDYGDCEEEANTTDPLLEIDEEANIISIGHSQGRQQCGVVRELILIGDESRAENDERIITIQQLYDDWNYYRKGNFIVIKDQNNKIISIPSIIQLNSEYIRPTYVNITDKTKLHLEFYASFEPAREEGEGFFITEATYVNITNSFE